MSDKPVHIYIKCGQFRTVKHPRGDYAVEAFDEDSAVVLIRFTFLDNAKLFTRTLHWAMKNWQHVNKLRRMF